MTKLASKILPTTLAVAIVALAAGSAAAFDVKRTVPESLASKEFFQPELSVSSSNVPAEALVSTLPNAESWGRLLASAGAGAQVYLDPRSGTPTNIIAAIPLIPGSGFGNQLTLESLATSLGRPVATIDEKLVADAVTRFIVTNREAIAIDVAQMGEVRAVEVTPELWHVRIPQQVAGIPVRHGHMVATISHGNMVVFGTEMWGNVRIDPKPDLTAEQAIDSGFAFAGGRLASDRLWQEPRLEIVPLAPPEHETANGFAGPVGQGYGHLLVWSFGFRREGDDASWEILVDAHSGKILALEDKNHYETKQVQGGVYPLSSTGICPTNDSCGAMQPGQPMPYANTGLPAPNDFSNAAGLFEYSAGTVTTSLNGKFVRILDSCGPVSEASPTGGLDLGGTNGQHDCTTAGTSAGDTSASRSGFYELNKLIEMAKGWLPGNAWLNARITSNMNLSQTCNAFYSTGDGTINFYRSGGGCRNTGELAAVFDHEWGHALDHHDSGGSLSSSSEAYADIAAIYRLRASCVGHGFFWTSNRGCGLTADGTGYNANESLLGSYCATNCSGVRDCDWGRHASGSPATALGFVCTHCSSGSGPCGRQVHCSAAPSRQAAWDLVARDLQAAPFHMTREDAFNVGAKIFYQGSGNIGAWHACTCGASSNGCGATNAYSQWLAADDDDGNLANGTPHMTAIFNAFNRHGIACTTPVAVNSGCAGGPAAAPVVTAETGNNRIDLSWSAVAGATRYRVLRTEGYARCDFGKAMIGETTGTVFSDTSVANDRPYYYVVQPVGSSGSCMGPGSECLTATPQPCAGLVATDRTVYNCSDVIRLTLWDADLTGAGSHAVSVSSSVETTPESVTLTETPSASGKFTGTIQTSSATPTPNGRLEVAQGGTVTVEYLDSSACGVPNVTRERTADIDCTGQPCSGTVSLDRSLYRCGDTLHLGLLDSDLAGAGSQAVTVSSTVEAAPETVVLVESPPGSGSFAGSIATTTASAASDGQLSVAHGAALAAHYLDGSACGIHNIAMQDTANADCASPVIANVRAEFVTGSTAAIRWDTNEPATSFVTYGPTPPPATTTPVQPALVTAHTVGLTGLPECSLQFYSVASADSLAQSSVADNAGAYFAFLLGADVVRPYPSADPPVAVPAQSAVPTIATVFVEDGRPIVDVDVRFQMTHSADGNTTVSLRHPDGTLVTLANHRGGFLDNFVSTVFDDEAGVAIGSGAAPFTGSFVPDGALSAFDTKSAGGTWQLEVRDDVAGDAGSITGFELVVTVAALPCGPNCVEESSARLSDACPAGGTGGANGYWDDGESATFRVSLRNTGQTPLTGVSATLAPVSPGVTMIDDFASYPDLARDASADSAAPHFAAHLPPGFSCGAPVAFDVAIHTDQGTFHDTVQVGTAGQLIPAGIATPLFERFTAGIPGDWTVEDLGSGGGAASSWTTANPGGRTGVTPISSPFAIVDSLAAGSGATQDERLVTRVLDLSLAPSVTLEFDAFFLVAGSERGDVDVRSSRTGGAWVNVHRYTGVSSPNPDHRVLDITNQAAGAADVQIRFRYDLGAFDNWWMIDNVKVTHPHPGSCMISSCAQVTPPGEVLRMLWDSRSSLQWTPAPAAQSYSLYRGAGFELPKLYTAETDSCARASTAATSASGISESPTVGSFSWWIVRAANANGLGPAGSGSSGPRVHDPLGVCP